MVEVEALTRAWRRRAPLPDWAAPGPVFPLVCAVEAGGRCRQVRLCALARGRGGGVSARSALDQCCAALAHGHWRRVLLPRAWRVELAVALDDLAALDCPAYAGCPWAVSEVEGLSLAGAARLMLTRRRRRAKEW